MISTPLAKLRFYVFLDTVEVMMEAGINRRDVILVIGHILDILSAIFVCGALTVTATKKGKLLVSVETLNSFSLLF